MMFTAVVLAVSLLLFVTGMQLSAFFSGSETGFYRVSQLQLTLQKQQGDPTARQLVSFAEHPARFVSTTLVGNNVANYLTTLAIGMFVNELIHTPGSAATAEISATLLLSPVIFIFGELIPKSLYYRAPLSLLRRRSGSFRFFYFLFLPLSYPLTLVAGLIARLTQQSTPSVDTMFGRTRMFGLIASGKRVGILTQVQGRLADNLMKSGDRIVAEFVAPVDVIPRIRQSADRKALLDIAQATQSSWVLLHNDKNSSDFTGVVRVATLLMSQLSPAAAAQPLLRFKEKTHPLVVLTEMFQKHAAFGIVMNEEGTRAKGIVRRDRLADRLLISQKRPPASRMAWES
jgi:putative hemolysin